MMGNVRLVSIWNGCGWLIGSLLLFCCGGFAERSLGAGSLLGFGVRAG